MEEIFVCKKCGECCKGFGGTYISRDDIFAISEYIGEDPEAFLEKYCTISGGTPLLSQAENGWCIFWDEVCTIHPVKPRMCRAWPFIESILVDVENWHIMAGSCPGMRTDFSDEIILNQVKIELDRTETGLFVLSEASGKKHPENKPDPGEKLPDHGQQEENTLSNSGE